MSDGSPHRSLENFPDHAKNHGFPPKSPEMDDPDEESHNSPFEGRPSPGSYPDHAENHGFPPKSLEMDDPDEENHDLSSEERPSPANYPDHAENHSIPPKTPDEVHQDSPLEERQTPEDSLRVVGMRVPSKEDFPSYMDGSEGELSHVSDYDQTEDDPLKPPQQEEEDDALVVYHCWICSVEFVEKVDIIRHLKEWHKDRSEVQGLDRLMKVPVCLECGVQGECEHQADGERPDEDEGGAAYMYRPRFIMCVSCPEQFLSPEALRTHRAKDHPTEPSHQCIYCPEVFNDHPSLVSHNRIHMGHRPYICTHCGNRFTKLSDLKRHEMTHKGIKPFKCLQCFQTFTQKSSLEKHARMHARRSGKVACLQCGLLFETKELLWEHAKEMHTETCFQCKTCGKMYAEERYLLLHVRTHDADHLKPFACSFCDRRFTLKHMLEKHEKRSHLNKREIKCHICDKVFKRNENLTRHMLSHSGVKNFQCSECGVGFTEKGSLTRHFRSQHQHLKPHSCPICRRGFTRKNLLRRHLERYHIRKARELLACKGDFFRCRLCLKLLRKTGRRQHERHHRSKGDVWEGSLAEELVLPAVSETAGNGIDSTSTKEDLEKLLGPDLAKLVSGEWPLNLVEDDEGDDDEEDEENNEEDDEFENEEEGENGREASSPRVKVKAANTRVLRGRKRKSEEISGPVFPSRVADDSEEEEEEENEDKSETEVEEEDESEGYRKVGVCVVPTADRAGSLDEEDSRLQEEPGLDQPEEEEEPDASMDQGKSEDERELEEGFKSAFPEEENNRNIDEEEMPTMPRMVTPECNLEPSPHPPPPEYDEARLPTENVSTLSSSKSSYREELTEAFLREQHAIRQRHAPGSGSLPQYADSKSSSLSQHTSSSGSSSRAGHPQPDYGGDMRDPHFRQAQLMEAASRVEPERAAPAYPQYQDTSPPDPPPQHAQRTMHNSRFIDEQHLDLSRPVAAAQQHQDLGSAQFANARLDHLNARYQQEPARISGTINRAEMLNSRYQDQIQRSSSSSSSRADLIDPIFQEPLPAASSGRSSRADLMDARFQDTAPAPSLPVMDHHRGNMDDGMTDLHYADRYSESSQSISNAGLGGIDPSGYRYRGGMSSRGPPAELQQQVRERADPQPEDLGRYREGTPLYNMGGGSRQGSREQPDLSNLMHRSQVDFGDPRYREAMAAYAMMGMQGYQESMMGARSLGQGYLGIPSWYGNSGISASDMMGGPTSRASTYQHSMPDLGYDVGSRSRGEQGLVSDPRYRSGSEDNASSLAGYSREGFSPLDAMSSRQRALEGMAMDPRYGGVDLGLDPRYRDPNADVGIVGDPSHFRHANRGDRGGDLGDYGGHGQGGPVHRSWT